MDFKSFKHILIAIIILFFATNLNAIPLPIPNISIQDIFKHGKRAIEKNRQDKNAQEEYKKKQEDFNKNINKKEDDEIKSIKNELRKKFNGIWSGEINIKKENILDISCKIKILIRNFEGKLVSSCKDIKLTIYLFINLDRNLENSYVLTSLENDKLKLFGDITSFAGNTKEIHIRGSLEKF